MLQRKDSLVRRKFMNFLFPSVFMAMSSSLSIIVDSMIVGNLLGSSELAAMNLIMPLSLCFTAVTAIFGIGSSIDIAMLKGKMNRKGADKCLSLSCLAWIVCSGITVLLGILASDGIAGFLAGTSGLEDLVAQYLRVYLIGSPFTFITMIFPHIIRSDGQPKLASNVLVIANLTNLALDLVFMGPFRMGLTGGALATICGYAFGSALYLLYVFSKERTLHLTRIGLSDFGMYLEMIKLSVSSILGQGLMFGKLWIFNMVISSIAGKEGLTAFSVCTSCLSFASMFIAGAAQTMMPMVGAFVGSKDHTAVGMTARLAFRTVIVCCGGAAVLFELFPAGVLRLFGVAGGSGLAVGMIAVREFSLALVGIGLTFLFMYYAQARKMTAFSMQICVLEGFVFIVPLGLLMANLFGMRGFWFAYPINEVLVLLFILLKTRRIAKKSGGQLYSVFLLKHPEEGTVELTLNVSDEKEREDALKLLFHREKSKKKGKAEPSGPDSGPGEEEKTEELADRVRRLLLLSNAAYESNGTRQQHRWMDIVKEKNRITSKDMGKNYEALREEHLRDKKSGIPFQHTMLIGMNYCEIRTGGENE